MEGIRIIYGDGVNSVATFAQNYIPPPQPLEQTGALVRAHLVQDLAARFKNNVDTSANVRWSQPVDATLYLRAKRWSVAMDERGFRRGFTAAEKTELWDRWQRGKSLKAIGRAFGKPSSSIYFQVSPHGGIRPVPRRRSRLALTLWEREEDVERHCGTSIGPHDGRVAGPLALDREPGNQPKWRL